MEDSQVSDPFGRGEQRTDTDEHAVRSSADRLRRSRDSTRVVSLSKVPVHEVSLTKLPIAAVARRGGVGAAGAV